MSTVLPCLLIASQVHHHIPFFDLEPSSIADVPSPLEVRVGSVPISKATPPNRNGNLLCTSINLPAGSVFPQTLNCQAGTVRGRFVSIQRTSNTGYLSLCDVKVR